MVPTCAPPCHGPGRQSANVAAHGDPFWAGWATYKACRRSRRAWSNTCASGASGGTRRAADRRLQRLDQLNAAEWAHQQGAWAQCRSFSRACGRISSGQVVTTTILRFGESRRVEAISVWPSVSDVPRPRIKTSMGSRPWRCSPALALSAVAIRWPALTNSWHKTWLNASSRSTTDTRMRGALRSYGLQASGAWASASRVCVRLHALLQDWFRRGCALRAFRQAWWP